MTGMFSHGGTKNSGLFALDWIEKVESFGAEILLTLWIKMALSQGLI